MRADLDRLMQQHGLAGLVVFAYDRYSPALYYVTGQKLHYGVYVRAAGGEAHLVHDPMERDDAAKVGCSCATFPERGLEARMERAGHPAKAFGGLIAEVCKELGIEGPVGWYGDMAMGVGHLLVAQALQANPDLRVDAHFPDVLAIARMTKDAQELEAVRHAAKGSVAAMERLVEYLRGLERTGDSFRANGATVTLGTLRRVLHQAFLANGVAEDDASIVSQGRDAGVPHNRGNDDEPLRAGLPLLVDIFPCEAGGGYHSDLTRTFCLGAAPGPLKRLHGEVHDAYRAAMDGLKLGAPCRSVQERVCDVFERGGHPTVRSRHGTQEGYVHSLGHGVGLAVHEAPRFGGPPSNQQPIEAGMVFSIEPGLYYPERGLGVRIEDLVVAHPDGTFENLTPAPYALEIGGT